jgi:hypothetical protein
MALHPGLAGSESSPAGRSSRYASSTGASSAGGGAVQDHRVGAQRRTGPDRPAHCVAGCRWPRPRATRRGAARRGGCSSSVVPIASNAPRGALHEGVLAEPLQRGGVPAVDAHEQVAVALQVGRQPADELAQPQLVSSRWSPTVASTDQTRTAPGRARPARRHGGPRDAARERLVGEEGVQHDPVGDRPASSRVRSPMAVSSTGMRSSKLVLVEAQHRERPAGPSWPDRPPRRATADAAGSIASVHLRRGDPRQAHDVEQHVEAAPEPEGEAAAGQRCIVVPKVAVTRGWRVLWFVAAVAMPSRSLTAPATAG